jgi:hypothetical protein
MTTGTYGARLNTGSIIVLQDMSPELPRRPSSMLPLLSTSLEPPPPRQHSIPPSVRDEPPEQRDYGVDLAGRNHQRDFLNGGRTGRSRPLALDGDEHRLVAGHRHRHRGHPPTLLPDRDRPRDLALAVPGLVPEGAGHARMLGGALRRPRVICDDESVRCGHGGPEASGEKPAIISLPQSTLQRTGHQERNYASHPAIAALHRSLFRQVFG